MFISIIVISIRDIIIKKIYYREKYRTVSNYKKRGDCIVKTLLCGVDEAGREQGHKKKFSIFLCILFA